MAQVIEVQPLHPFFNSVIYMGTPDELERFLNELVKLHNSFNDGRKVERVRADFVIMEVETEEVGTRIFHYQIIK